MMSPSPGISAFPNETNFLEWTATIEGPEGTPYAGLSLKLSFSFPSNYPYAAPTVLFKTPIYHPNIDFSGRICLDILKEKWSAIYNVQTVLLSLQSLLGEPNKYDISKNFFLRCWLLGPGYADTRPTAQARSTARPPSSGTRTLKSSSASCSRATAT